MTADSRLRSRRVAVNGIELHLVEAGEGRPVVLLHGFPEFWYSWRKQIGPLVDGGYRVIVPDLRGYNLSGKPRGAAAYSIDNVAADIVEVITALEAPVALVGHDWGGVIAWRVSKLAPQLLDSLSVLNIPHPRAVQANLRRPAQAVRFWYQFALQPPGIVERMLAARRYALLRYMLKRSVRDGAVSSDDLSRYVDAWRQPGALTGMLNYYRALVRRRPGKLAAMTSPDSAPRTMLIIGENEPVFQRRTLEESRHFLPSLKIELVRDAGHFVHQDQPDQVNELLLQFIARAT